MRASTRVRTGDSPLLLNAIGWDADGDQLYARILTIPTQGKVFKAVYDGSVDVQTLVPGDEITVADTQLTHVGNHFFYKAAEAIELSGFFAAYDTFTWTTADTCGDATDVGVIIADTMFPDEYPDTFDVDLTMEENTGIEGTVTALEVELLAKDPETDQFGQHSQPLLFLITKLPEHGTLTIVGQARASLPFADPQALPPADTLYKTTRLQNISVARDGLRSAMRSQDRDPLSPLPPSFPLRPIPAGRAAGDAVPALDRGRSAAALRL